MTISKPFSGTPPSCFEVMGWVGGIQDFSVSLIVPFGLIGVGSGLDWVGIGLGGLGTKGLH